MDGETFAQLLKRAANRLTKEAMSARNAGAAAVASPLTPSQDPASPAVSQQVGTAVIVNCFFLFSRLCVYDCVCSGAVCVGRYSLILVACLCLCLPA